jgi:hypothetical protein
MVSQIKYIQYAYLGSNKMAIVYYNELTSIETVTNLLY